MKLNIMICLMLIFSVSSGTCAKSARAEVLWNKGKTLIQTVKCAENRSDGAGHCLAIQVVAEAGVSIVGDKYARVKILWSKKPGQSGPDALLLGDYGGSSGLSDLIAVSFSPRTIVRKTSVQPGDEVTIDSGVTSLCLNLPFVVGGFNQASNSASTVVPIPICWSSGAFVLNDEALLARSFSSEDLSFRELAIQSELERWADDSFPETDLYPVKTTGGTPVTARALVDLILSGHADLARDILHKNWPRTHADSAIPMGGEANFWESLCQLIVKNQDWRVFHLDQLPNANLIEEGAKSAVH